MKKRSFALYLLFFFLTFGLYGIYHYITLTNSLNRVLPRKIKSYLWVVLLFVPTFGIYSIVWFYRLGRGIDAYMKQYGASSAIDGGGALSLTLFSRMMQPLVLVRDCLIVRAYNDMVELQLVQAQNLFAYYQP
jgi:hypothetical protein